MAIRKPPSPEDTLRVDIAKGNPQDLLASKPNQSRTKLEQALDLALTTSSSTTPLSQEQSSLLATVCKQLVLLNASNLTQGSVPSPSPSPSPVPLTTTTTGTGTDATKLVASLLFSEAKQLDMAVKLGRSIDASHKGISSQALVALEGYIALSKAIGEPLESLAQRCVASPLLAKSAIQTLTLLVPTLPSTTLTTLSPTLMADLLNSFSDRHLSQARGKLVAQLILAQLQAEPAETQRLLLSTLLGYNDVERFNMAAFTLRHVSEQKASFLVDLSSLLNHEPSFLSHPSRQETFITIATLANSLSQCTDISVDLAPSSSTPTLSTSSTSTLPSTTTIPRVFLDRDMIAACLSHPSPSVRIGAFSLITDKMNSSSPLSSIEASLVKEFLEMNSNSGENEIRHQIVHRVTKLLVRMRASCFAVDRDFVKLSGRTERTPAEDQELSEARVAVARSRDLLGWFTSHLTSQLRPLASFPRTILSLRLIDLLCASGLFSDIVSHPTAVKVATPWPFEARFFDETVVKALIKCLTSTYGEARIVAADLLERSASTLPGLDSPESLDQLESEAFDLSCNPRGSESSGGALALRLVCKLRFGTDQAGQATFVSSVLDQVHERLEASKADIVRAARDLPVHGLLQLLQETLIRVHPSPETHVLWQPIFQRTLSLVHAVWNSTRGVLSASPAEHSSEDAVDHEEARALLAIEASGNSQGEDGEGGVGLRHQIVLSWAWRAIKESSTLLSTIFTSPLRLASRSATSSPFLWSQDDLRIAGAHFVTLLTEIRHPGVFLAIFPNYAEVVRAIAKFGGAEAKKLPREWLQAHIAALNVDQHTSGRRSAGLPYGVLSVMISEPSVVQEGFDEIFKLARSPVETVVVAAVNTLQVLLSDAKLSGSFPVYFEEAVIIALDSMRSLSWAVRNVGLLLIGNLVKRAFDQRSQDVESYSFRQEASVWFAQYPKLLPLFVSVLEKDETEGSIFAVLQILKNLRATDALASNQQEDIVRALTTLAGSKKLDIREAAAAALPAVVAPSSIPEFLPLALEHALTTSSQNERHGRLLQAIALLTCYTSRPLPEEFIDELDELTETLLFENPCGPTQALFLRFLTVLSSRSPKIQLPFYSALIYCSQLTRNRLSTATSVTAAPPGNDALHLASTRFILSQPSTVLSSELILTLLGRDDESAEITLLQAEDDSALAKLASSEILTVRATVGDSMRCRRPALRLLARRTEREALYGLDWKTLMSEFDATNNEPLKEDLLPVLGRLVGRAGSPFDTIETTLDRLNVASADNQSEDMRRAASMAITHLAPRIYANLGGIMTRDFIIYALRGKFQRIVIRLLQDDDSSIRAEASNLVTRCLSSKAPLSHEHAVRAWWAHCSAIGAQEGDWKRWLWDQLMDRKEIDAALTTLNDPVSTLFASEAENRYIEPVVQLEAFSSALLAALTSSSSSESPTPDELMTEFETTLSTFRTDRLAHQSEDTTTTTFLADPALTGVVFTVRSRFLLALFALSSSSPSSSSSYSTEATDELKGAASSSDATVVDRARLDRAFAQVFEVLGN